MLLLSTEPLCIFSLSYFSRTRLFILGGSESGLVLDAYCQSCFLSDSNSCFVFASLQNLYSSMPVCCVIEETFSLNVAVKIALLFFVALDGFDNIVWNVIYYRQIEEIPLWKLGNELELCKNTTETLESLEDNYLFNI